MTDDGHPFTVGAVKKGSNDLLNFAGTDAAGTDLHGFDRTLMFSTDFLQVWIPDRAGFIMGVTDVVSANRLFAANSTFFSHLHILLKVSNAN